MNASLLVRNLEPETKAALRAQAARNGRSMSAEARIILREALLRPQVNPLSAAEHADRFFPPELRIEGGLVEYREPAATPPGFE